MTRVALVCADPGVPVFGHKGCAVHVREICGAMLDVGLDVTLFASARGGAASPRLARVPVVDLPSPAATDHEGREREAIEANAAIGEALDAEGPFDLVYERAALWTWAPMAYAVRTGAPGILELNAPLTDEQARYRVLVQGETARALLAASLRAARLVAAVSHPVAAWAQALAGPAVNVAVVPNGVDPRRFCVARAPGRPAGEFVVGFVGTLKPWHGLPALVEAFALIAADIPGARLLVVGDGPERSRMEQAIAGHGLADRATITGPVAHDAVPGLLAQMDVAVAPYPPLEDFYFSPLKLTEYMAAGLPVVASAVGQVASLITDEHTGLLYPPGDVEALAASLARLHADDALRRRLGDSARAHVTAHHTWRLVLDRVLHLAGAPRGSGMPQDEPPPLVAPAARLA